MRELESSELTLEQSLALFEEGIAQLRVASDELGRADAAVKVLVERANGVLALTEFRG